MSAVATIAAPPIASRTAGEAFHFFAWVTAIPASELMPPASAPLSSAVTAACVKLWGGSLGTMRLMNCM